MAIGFNVKGFIGRHKVLAAFAAAALFLFVLIAWPSINWSHDINIRIVNEHTGHPIAGAVAVANWAIEGCFPESCDVSELTVKEGASNASGRLRIAGWGPKLLFFHGEVNYSAPKIVVFKPGYEVEVLYNKPGGQWHARSASDWNGKTISLKPLNGVAEARSRQLETLTNELDYVTRFPEGCYWTRIPVLIKQVAIEEGTLRRQVGNQFSIVDDLRINSSNYSRRAPSGCVTPKEVIEGEK